MLPRAMGSTGVSPVAAGVSPGAPLKPPAPALIFNALQNTSLAACEGPLISVRHLQSCCRRKTEIRDSSFLRMTGLGGVAIWQMRKLADVAVSAPLRLCVSI